MGKLVRTVVSFVVSYLILFAFRSIIPIEGFWIVVVVCVVCSYPILYSGRSFHAEQKSVREEYIIDLHNDKVGEKFVASKYPGYRKERSGFDGNDYMSSSGSIICTKFIDKKQEIKVKDSAFSTHLFCILMCVFIILMCSAFTSKLTITKVFESHSIILTNNFSELGHDGFTVMIKKIEQNALAIRPNMERILERARYNVLLTSKYPMNGVTYFKQGWKELVERIIYNKDAIIKDIMNIIG